MKNLVFSALGSSAFAVFALGFSLHTAAAQDLSSHQLPAASPSGWGSGPMMVSLLVSARHEGPVRGIEPAPTFVAPVRDALVPPAKVEPTLPTTRSVEALEQSIATATSRDFRAKDDRQVAVASH